MKIIFIIYHLIATFIMFMALLGNVLGVIALSLKKNKMKSLRIKFIYKYLFLINLSHLLKMIFELFGFSLIDTYIPCKYLHYVNYSVENLSSMLLIYILLERVVSLICPIKRRILQKEKTQKMYLSVLIAFNFVYFSPYLYLSTVNETKNCQLNDPNLDHILNLMEILNRAIVPSLLISIMNSIVIWKSITKPRKTSMTTVTCILLGLFYLLLTLPLTLMLSLDSAAHFSDNAFHLAMFLFYSSYGVDFYVICVFNSRFRRKFLQF